MSCRRRLRDRHEAAVWAALHRALLERLHAAGRLDRRRAALDSASVPARRGGGEAPGPDPTGGGKPATKRHGWAVERSLAWPDRLRRLAVRYGRRADIRLASATLGRALAGRNRAKRFCRARRRLLSLADGGCEPCGSTAPLMRSRSTQTMRTTGGA